MSFENKNEKSLCILRQGYGLVFSPLGQPVVQTPSAGQTDTSLEKDRAICWIDRHIPGKGQSVGHIACPVVPGSPDRQVRSDSQVEIQPVLKAS